MNAVERRTSTAAALQRITHTGIDPEFDKFDGAALIPVVQNGSAQLRIALWSNFQEALMDEDFREENSNI